MDSTAMFSSVEHLVSVGRALLELQQLTYVKARELVSQVSFAVPAGLQGNQYV
jgi:hypothetical protein